ncbi:uncharacterized protein LOC114470550 isoform X2 [Gouania willdenowi]|uniref:uncharacterized protein LOC114470550 isoform X2 n=1 Tax=Gouania willdenowi TaxID=441366 RepID=UPI001055F91E|nr:uncharacterized protein LOC114470550 isoform X2 [Gouania willdenowi]
MDQQMSSVNNVGDQSEFSDIPESVVPVPGPVPVPVPGPSIQHLPVEVMQHLAVLKDSHSQLEYLSKDLKQWVNVVDEEMSELRSQNSSMLQYIKRLEKLLSEKAHTEAETHRFLGDKINPQKMNKMEKEAALMMEETQKLTAELRNLQEEKQKTQANMICFMKDLKTMKCHLDQVVLQVQKKDEIIHQGKLKLKRFEETVGEYTNIIEKRQLEEALERTPIERAISLPLSNDLQGNDAALMEENQKLTAQEQKRQLEKALERTPHSTAQESDLMIPVKEEMTSTFHSLNIKQEETEPEDQTDPTVVHQHYQRDDQSCANKKKEESSGWSWTFCLMSVLIIFLTLVVFVAPGCSYQLCPLLKDLLKMLQPHLSLTYKSRPPM